MRPRGCLTGTFFFLVKNTLKRVHSFCAKNKKLFFELWFLEWFSRFYGKVKNKVSTYQYQSSNWSLLLAKSSYIIYWIFIMKILFVCYVWPIISFYRALILARFFLNRITSMTILNRNLKLFIYFRVDIWAQKWLHSVFLLTLKIHFSAHATFDR